MTPVVGARRSTPDRSVLPRRLLAAVLAVVLLVGVVVVGVLLLGSDDAPDDTSGPLPGTADSVPSSEATESEDVELDPLDDPFSVESLDLRYAALGRSVTAGFVECRRAKAREGQKERAVCVAGPGTLELVTYRGRRALETRREKAITYQAGGVLDVRKNGVLMGHQSENRRGAPVDAFLYRDDTPSLTSATYFAERGTDLDSLAALLAETDPVRPYPTGPSAPPLVDFAEQWVDLSTCMRIETVNDGALEESYCDVKGPFEVYVGRFRSDRELSAYRRLVLASAIDDERDVRDWNQREGDAPVGALYEYTTDSGAVVRYWDKPGCACYAEAFLPGGTYERLQRWWLGDR